MLANKLALSLPTINKVGAIAPPPPPWEPTDELSLIAWYKHKTALYNVNNQVEEWDDSSGNGYLMVGPSDKAESPTYDVNTGELFFKASALQRLQLDTGLQIGIPKDNDFTIGFKMNAGGTNNTILGDNTTASQFFKITANDQLRFKTNDATATIQTDSTLIADIILIITRVADNVSVHIDGVLQSNSLDVSGLVLIDAIGIRAVDLNSYEGTISEIQIYGKADTVLTSNVNTYLSNI